jgi:plasmid segregation protein ParM
MLSIGLQIGHGHVKAAAATGRVATFPAVAAPAPVADFAGLGAARQVVTLDDSAWLVGRDALDFAPGRLVSILDRSRYRSPSFVALARHALAQVAPREAGPLAVMTGCPAAWFADSATRSDLEAAILDAAAPWGHAVVTVAPEPAGPFYAHIFESGVLDVSRTRGAVGVIDLGYRDVNVASFSEGRYVAGESVPGGLAEGLKECKRLISAGYGLELSLHQVDQAVREGVVIVEGQPCKLPPGTEAALAGGLDTVIATARSLFPNGGRGLRALLLAGGGAAVLGAALRRTFPQAQVLREPQLAGARGFAAAAQAQASRAQRAA